MLKRIKADLNKYDIFLIILIMSLAFGAVGGAFQIPRLCCVVFSPNFFMKIGSFGKYIKKQTKVTIFFLIYCIVSLTWTPDRTEGIKDFIYFIIHFLLYFEIIIFAMCAKKPLESISKGWAIAVLLTVIFAMWEFQTGFHLPYCRNGEDVIANLGNGEVYYNNKFAAVAFSNYNTFVTFLCFAIPFLFYTITKRKDNKFIVYLFAVVLVLAADYCILKNASRGGLLAIIVQSAIYFMMKPKNKSWFISIALLVLLVNFVFLNYSDEFIYIISRASDGNLVEGGARLVLWQYAWDRFLETFGLGVGIGGMYEAMQGVASYIYITHSIFVEVLFLYGIVFFLVFVNFLIKMFLSAIKIKEYPIRVTLYCALISFPIYGIINSGYLSHPFVFVGLASIYVYSDFRRIYAVNKLQS